MFNTFRPIGFGVGPIVAGLVVSFALVTLLIHDPEGTEAAAGDEIAYGFATPFAFSGVLAALALVLTYTQVEDTVTPGASGDPDALARDG